LLGVVVSAFLAGHAAVTIEIRFFGHFPRAKRHGGT